MIIISFPQSFKEFVIIGAVLLFLIYFIKQIVTLLNRKDIPGMTKFMWMILIISFPIIGLAIYVNWRPPSSNPAL